MVAKLPEVAKSLSPAPLQNGSWVLAVQVQELSLDHTLQAADVNLHLLGLTETNLHLLSLTKKSFHLGLTEMNLPAAAAAAVPGLAEHSLL